MSAPNTTRSIYFGYGSNLWRSQMLKRCPDSTFMGVGRLEKYRWIINDRGYANVVPVSTSTLPAANATTLPPPSNSHLPKGSEDVNDHVYGLIYSLSPSDEAKLDINEGIPHCYEKEMMDVTFYPSNTSTTTTTTTTPSPSLSSVALEDREHRMENMLVYIDHQRVEEDEPKKEYIYRINMGIVDAVVAGVPEGYVKGVLRRFIPPLEEGEGGEEAREVAERQAERFVDV